VNGPYELAFAFWKLLSYEQAELPGGVALANLEVPMLLSNAAWFPRAGGLRTVAAWYDERGLNAALVAPASKGAALERSLQEGPFGLEATFTLAEPGPATASSLVVEQASWAQARVAADRLASHYGFPDYGPALGKTLARAMQAEPAIGLYLTYDDGAHDNGAHDDAPLAAMVTFDVATFERDGSLTAMLMSEPRAPLTERLLREAGARRRKAQVFEAAPAGAERDAVLEYWSIR
jgi:hypothetical protein